MFAIEIHDADRGVDHIWGCRDAAGPAVLLTRSTMMAMNLSYEGIDLHGPDAVAGLGLARRWGLDIPALDAGQYMPTDGVKFLLALYSTYFRGSRIWAEPGHYRQSYGG